MAKYNLTDDYSEGIHPKLLKALIQTNQCQQVAYGCDEHSKSAASAIRRKLQCSDEVGIWFVPSGTSANAISIASCLRPHEAVIAASSGHIVVRETGAVEATGHKIINVDPVNGKLTTAAIEQALEENWHFPHMAKPRMIYISNATEIGTVYSRTELQALKKLCVKRGLLMFMDGARLGTAMACDKNDVSWPEVLELTDIFWIGGTKNGALLGEAIVIKNQQLAAEFGFHVKQHGCLLAKSWAMGAQFAALFSDDDLYRSLALHANSMAARLSEAILKAGYRLLAETETNQVFAVLPLSLVERLHRQFNFFIWKRIGTPHGHNEEQLVVRLVTSWATIPEQIEKFIETLTERKLVAHL